MARIGKITITVNQTARSETVSIRTTGSRGTILLNTISNDVQYPSQSPSPDAITWWTAVLNRALVQL